MAVVQITKENQTLSDNHTLDNLLLEFLKALAGIYRTTSLDNFTPMQEKMLALDKALKDLGYERFANPMMESLPTLLSDLVTAISKSDIYNVQEEILKKTESIIQTNTNSLESKYTGRNLDDIEAEIASLEQAGVSSVSTAEIEARQQELQDICTEENADIVKLSSLKVKQNELKERLQSCRDEIMAVTADYQSMSTVLPMSQELQDSLNLGALRELLNVDIESFDNSYSTKVLANQKDI